MRTRARHFAVLVIVGAALAVSACASSSSSEGAVEDYAGAPKGVTDLPETADGPFASWQGDGEGIAITLFGSSGCPPIGETLTVRSSNSLSLALVPIPADKVCTADYAPHTTVFDKPENVTTTSDVTIEVEGETITLKALPNQ